MRCMVEIRPTMESCSLAAKRGDDVTGQHQNRGSGKTCGGERKGRAH